MTQAPPTPAALQLRYMRLPDVPQVVTIDHLSFQPPWSARSYAYEVNESNYSHMVVLEYAPPPPKAPTGIRKWFSFGAREQDRQIVAYGGLWVIGEEAHISTIATHPDQRGRGYGELVLAAMIQRAINFHAAFIVLEVRVSNTVAQALYTKYGFRTVSTKRKYYHNNNEDAYEMRLILRDPTFEAEFKQHFAALLAYRAAQDRFTEGSPPRERR